MPADSVIKDLRAKGRAAFFIFLESVNELTAKTESAPSYFIAGKDYVLNIAKDFPGSANETELVDLRAGVIKRVRFLFSAVLYTDLARDWVLHGGLLNRAASAAQDELPGGALLFADHLQAMIDKSGKDDRVALAAIQASMASIPLRMAALKYEEYITDAFKASDYGLNKADADYFKRRFNPGHFLESENRLEEFEEIIKPVDDVWLTDCTSIDAESEKRCLAELDNCKKKIIGAMDELTVIFDALNAAIIVKKSNPEISGNEKALSEDELDKAIEKEIGEITFGADAKETPEDADWGKIHKLFYETALDYFGASEEENNDEEDAEGFFAEFLPFTKAEGLAPNRRRFLRRRFMGFLPYPYPLETYRNYFISTYEALDEANRRYLAEYVKNGK